MDDWFHGKLGLVAAILLITPLPLSAADAPPDPADVTAAMKEATAFFTKKLAVHGGYASAWKRDLSAGETEHTRSKTVISIQPPGTTSVGLALVKACAATGDAQFLDAARAAAGVLVEWQLASGGWPQQYDGPADPTAPITPASYPDDWPRRWPDRDYRGYYTLNDGNLGHATRLMLRAHALTGDGKYLAPLPDALAWHERSALTDGTYARFYELRTNKPLYVVKDRYELTYDDTNLPTHYGFTLEHVARDVAGLRQLVKQPRDTLLASRIEPTTEKAWTRRAQGVVGRVRDALKAKNGDGVWIKVDRIDAGEFTRHMTAMARYVEAAREGGKEFAKRRATGT